MLRQGLIERFWICCPAVEGAMQSPIAADVVRQPAVAARLGDRAVKSLVVLAPALGPIDCPLGARQLLRALAERSQLTVVHLTSGQLSRRSFQKASHFENFPAVVAREAH